MGDSQAVLVKNGKPLDIMIPHKPEREEERKRIEDLGGFVAYVDTWRVNGTLAVSRAIGDPEHKPYISSEPDVTEITLDSDDDFLILACDGLWDQLTPEEATTLVYQYICENETENTQEIAENVASYLSKIAKEEGSSDNITTIILFFKDLSQLMATPFTPLSPRDRSLTSEMQQNGQFNGINSSHFQFSDSQYEYMQSTANPFDSNSTNFMTWNTPSPFDDIMNNAKLNIEVSESINSQNTNDSNEMSNPLNELTQQTPNNNIDITYENIVERNVESSELNVESVESLSREQHINPFDTTDKQSFYSNESQLHSLIDNSNARAVQTADSGSIYSNISDFSASFPFSQTGINQLDPALCSTPLQTTQSSVVDSFDPIIQENIDSQTMDYTTDERDLCGFGFKQSSQSNIDGLQNVESKDDMNVVSKEPNLDNKTNERNQTQNYSFNNSEIEENSLLETTQWETAQSVPSFLNNAITVTDKDNERSTCLLEEYNNDITQVVESQEQSFVAFNQNQEFQDISSGNESVDSIVYEKVNTDSDLVTEMNDNMIENKENNGQLLENKENVALKTEEHSLLENIEPNFADISSESVESKPEQYSMFENMVSKPELDSSQFIDSNLEKYPNLDNQESTSPKKESQNFEPEVKEDIFAENDVKMDTKQNEFSSIGKVETNSSGMVSNSMELKTEESSMSLTIETDSKESSFKTNESKDEEYMLLENEVSNTRIDDDSKAEEILLLANMVVNSAENISASEVSKLEESLLSDFAESKAPEISSADVGLQQQTPNESLKSKNIESKSSEKSTKKLDSKQKDSMKSMNIESKPKDKSSANSSAPLKTSKAVPSKTLNKTSTLLSKSSKTTTTANKTLANTNIKPLSPEKVATKQPLVGVRPKTTPITANNGPSRPTAKTTSTSAPKASDTSKPSRPLVSRVSGSRLTPVTASTSAAAKPLTSAPKPSAAKASDTKVSSPKALPTKTSTVARTTATTSATSKPLSTTRTASSALTAKTSATNVSSLSRKPTTQTTSATNLRPKTTSTTTATKVGAVNGKPVSTKPQTSTLKSVTSKIDSGKSLTASNKTNATNRLVVKSSTVPTKPGVKPIPIKGENKVSAVTKTNSIPTTSNGLSSKTVNKHNNPLNVPKPLKQELEDADLLSQPTGFSSIEIKRSDNMSPIDLEANFSSPDTAEKAFILSKNGSLDMTCISNTSGFEISPNNINDSNLNSRDHNSDHNSNSLLL